jgi:hypothetical protein
MNESRDCISPEKNTKSPEKDPQNNLRTIVERTAKELFKTSKESPRLFNGLIKYNEGFSTQIKM